jgi:ketosteroid isomerase-like protein
VAVHDDNVATIRRVYDAFTTRDMDVIQDHVPEVHVRELRDGKVVRFTVYIDTPAMLAALRS